ARSKLVPERLARIASFRSARSLLIVRPSRAIVPGAARSEKPSPGSGGRLHLVDARLDFSQRAIPNVGIVSELAERPTHRERNDNTAPARGTRRETCVHPALWQVDDGEARDTQLLGVETEIFTGQHAVGNREGGAKAEKRRARI